MPREPDHHRRPKAIVLLQQPQSNLQHFPYIVLFPYCLEIFLGLCLFTALSITGFRGLICEVTSVRGTATQVSRTPNCYRVLNWPPAPDNHFSTSIRLFILNISSLSSFIMSKSEYVKAILSPGTGVCRSRHKGRPRYRTDIGIKLVLLATCPSVVLLLSSAM